MEELVEKAKNKDKSAFAELISNVKKELYLIARLKLKNEDDIADAIQETLLRCYKNIRKLQNNTMFKTWIVKILINECNKIYKRRNKKIISYEENELEKYIATNSENDNMEFDILINDLNDEEKLILTLFYCNKYTVNEISAILKIKENTIKSKMLRARNKIRKKIEGDDKNVERY